MSWPDPRQHPISDHTVTMEAKLMNDIRILSGRHPLLEVSPVAIIRSAHDTLQQGPPFPTFELES